MSTQNFYYLIPGEEDKVFSILCSHTQIYNNGKNGRWKYPSVTLGESLGAFVVPITTKAPSYSKFKQQSKGHHLSFAATQAEMEKVSRCKESNDYTPAYITYEAVEEIDSCKLRYLSIDSKGDLYLMEHEKGDWYAEIGHFYFDKKTVGKYILEILVGSSVGEQYKTYTIYGSKSTKGTPTSDDSLWKDRTGGGTSNGFRVNHVTLNFTKKLLAKNGEYDIGAAYSGQNIGNNYCFYCNDMNQSNLLSYICSVPYVTIPEHIPRVHGCSKHGGKPTHSETTENGGRIDYYNPDTKYTPNGKPNTSSLVAPDKLEYGTVGDYKDGVATTPYVMIELKGSDDAKVGYNLSIPANSFVSLSHERNMSDSYNTFVLQLFDKDAMEVEAKLLLGFRYLTFYYTDFVSTSKRYKGEILNYKTVITGKGLMLTLEGYSSNVNTYIGKDSIPWSLICEANAPGFYYWMNEAKEYHGEVRISTDASSAGAGVYNSSEGVLISPNDVPNAGLIGSYNLLVPGETDSDGNPVPDKWESYNSYYSSMDESVRKQYEPKAHLWTLSTNGYNAQLDNVLADYMLSDNSFQFKDKRPSDIVRLICIINKWPYKIKQTKKVTEIPDQISMSYVEYIKEKLIPISVEEGDTCSTQYYFWFDDDGVAHYEPYSGNDSNIKKLYFNSVQHKDSYPLIGFTSATNGSVLMVTDASNTMEAINAITGDELSLTAVADVTNDPKYLSTIVETAEWYATNKLTVAQNKSLSLISYSNVSTLPSESDLKNQLLYRYGRVSRYTYKANLDVYGCADLTPGDYIEIYIYLADGARSNAAVSSVTKEYEDAEWQMNNTNILTYLPEERHYEGNITMHHTSGRYLINKITDTISGGKYISSLEVLKVDKNKLVDTITYDTVTDSETTESNKVGSNSSNSDRGGGGGSW